MKEKIDNNQISRNKKIIKEIGGWIICIVIAIILALLIKFSLNIPLCRKNQPKTITRKIGNVTLTLYIKFSSMTSFHISGTDTLNQNRSAPRCLP